MCVRGIATSKYINLYTDFAFKKIFGTEANKDILISFLNTFLEFEGDKAIEDIEYINPEQLGDTNRERRAIYDVYCTTKEGERFIVEMQRAKQDYFKDRALYYSSFAIREQGQKGGDKPWDYHLMPVYVIGILDFRIDDDPTRADKVITRVRLKDDDNRTFSDRLQLVFLEMPKFRKREDELESFSDKWLFVIKNLYQLDDKPKGLTEGIFKKLFKEASVANLQSPEKEEYEESLKIYRDWYNVIDTAKNEGLAEGRAEGEAKGRAEGLAEGRAEGLAEGEAKGRAEGLAEGAKQQAIETARKMKAKGLDFETIADFTGLSAEEIKNL